MPKIKAIIFDMDDTLAATSALWKKAEENFLQWAGASYTEELAQQYKGMNALDIGAYIHQVTQPESLSLEQCRSQMRECLIKEYQDRVLEMPGASNLLNLLRGNFKMAIASGSPHIAIEKVINSNHWGGFFETFLTSEDVKKGKPSPDVFLATAKKLSVDPSETLVFEDSCHGAEAASRAGMTCFAVPSSEQARAQIKAHRIYNSLDEVTLQDIQHLS